MPLVDRSSAAAVGRCVRSAEQRRAIASRTATARRGSPPPSTATVTGPCRVTAGVQAVAACRSSARTQKTRRSSAGGADRRPRRPGRRPRPGPARRRPCRPAANRRARSSCSRPASARPRSAGVSSGDDQRTRAPAASSAGTRRVATAPPPTTSTRRPVQPQRQGVEARLSSSRRHPARVEGGHLVQHPDRAGDDRQASTAPVPSPRRSPRSSSGSRPRWRSATRGARLDRAVPGDHRVPAASGASAAAASAAADGDHAVEDHRHPARGGAEDEAGQRGVLQAADRGQHADRVAPGRARAAPARPAIDRRSCGRGSSSSMPVPGRSPSPGRAPVNAAISAADGVVLAMPMSPVSRTPRAVVDQLRRRPRCRPRPRRAPRRGSSRARRVMSPGAVRAPSRRGSGPSAPGRQIGRPRRRRPR